MTQRELGELLGVTERSVAAYERGEVIPFRFLRRLGEIFGKEPAWILHGEAAFEVKDEQFKQILKELAELRAEMKRLAETRELAGQDGTP